MSRLVLNIFTEVAESEFRTQPIATAVSATGGVGTTPTCTRADAHFFVRTPQCTIHTTLHFSNVWHTALPQGEKELVSRSRLHSFSISLDMSLLNVPFSRFPQVLSSPTPDFPNLSDLNLVCRQQTKPLCFFVYWGGVSGCFANPTRNTRSMDDLMTSQSISKSLLMILRCLMG